MNWKYTDRNHNHVGKMNEDGSFTSMVSSNQEIRDYLSNGGIIDPADNESFDVIKSDKKLELRDNFNRFFETKPDGNIRYDMKLNVNTLLALVLNLMQSKSPSSKILNTINWALTVQQVYLQIKNEINIITSVEDLNNIDISYEWFEERYGINGTILADPDLRTEKLFESE